MDIVFSDIWQWLKDSLTVPGALAVVIVVFLIRDFIKHKLFKDSVEKDRATATEKKARDTYNNKGSVSAPIVQGNGTVGDIVTGNKETYSAPVVQDSTVGGDVTFGNKTTHIHQAPVDKSPAEKRHDLVDKMVEKIRLSCQSVQTPTDRVRDMFECMVCCITQANASQSLDEAMEFILGERWSSDYGTLHKIQNQICKATDDYSAAGRAYYEVTPRRAVELGLDAVEVQNEVWNELSCDEHMVLILYGATRLHYRIEDQSNELRGTGLEFSLLVVPLPWSKQFDIMRVAYRLLADGSRNIADIIVEEHARCQEEKALKGRL